MSTTQIVLLSIAIVLAIHIPFYIAALLKLAE
jgi:hypothetical protein